MSMTNIVRGKDLTFEFRWSKEDSSLRNSSIITLLKRFDEDLFLRQFFVGKVFREHFDDNNWFHKFVIQTKVFPVVQQSYGHDVLDFFQDLQSGTDNVFTTHNATVKDFCGKACDIGILQPQSHIVDPNINGTLNLILSQDNYDGLKSSEATFYKIIDEIDESWIAPQNKGRMLELWTYFLLRNYFANSQYEVKDNAQFFESKELDLIKGIADVSKQYKLTGVKLGQVDCLVKPKKQQDTITGLVECKMDRDYGWAGVRAFIGSKRLFNAQFGVIIIGHDEKFKTDRTLKNENIKIFADVLKRDDFPQALFNYLDEKLPN